MQGLAIVLILLALAGGAEGEIPPDGYTPPPLPPDEDDDGFTLTGETIPAEGEPPVPPGPVDRPDMKVDIPPDDTAEWLAAVEDLISDTPTPGKFWQVSQGSTGVGLANALLSGPSNNGSNRVRLLKCITRSPWNWEHYAADAGRGTWGTLFDVDGLNISAAWMPRHPSARQALANRQNPERGVDEQGRQVGDGGYYGLLWIPPFVATSNALVCGAANNPPPWLMDRLQG